MKKTKIMAVFMAACMAVTALGGCSGQSGTDSTTGSETQAAGNAGGESAQTQPVLGGTEDSDLEAQPGGTLTIAIPNYTPLLDPKDYTQSSDLQRGVHGSDPGAGDGLVCK